ncbi:MAG: hypothetical protein H6Q90_261 [Deltaproteobacteria bacterium]|nr:hypothetical protein [Deltaproteobacteria bacterium]
MTRNGITLTILVASLGLAGCGGLEDTAPPADPGGDGTAGGSDTTFDHDNSGFNPFDLLDRLAKEGPPKFTSHVHSCAKVRYRTLGNVMRSVGIDPTNTADLSAGQLYTDGFNALGGPNFANRIRENLSITTSGASREFDIFAAGADEVIAALPTLARCQVNGVGPQLFEPGTNQCRADGIACLIGTPAQAAHLDFCNLTVSSASDPLVGKRIAVAALLAAAYTCE